MTQSLFTRSNAAATMYVVNTQDASDAQLSEISRELGLGLSLQEMKTVQAYFKTKKRNPTDVELQTIAQTWSEHCYHKTFKGKIRIGNRTINSLFKTYIAKATREIHPQLVLQRLRRQRGHRPLRPRLRNSRQSRNPQSPFRSGAVRRRSHRRGRRNPRHPRRLGRPHRVHRRFRLRTLRLRLRKSFQQA